ncbi:MAG: response regulator transcription factor [Nitrospirae bacterium]|nr:response regulator transcription factor [Nitrospirota bacterium]
MVHFLLRQDPKHREVLAKTVRFLNPSIQEILRNWMKAYQAVDRGLSRPALRCMEQLGLDWFETLSDEREGVSFDRFNETARQLCRKGVDFDRLVLAFHLIEDACHLYLQKAYPKKDELVEAMVAMDYMCHACFSALASSYFDEKYTRIVRSPRQSRGFKRMAEAYDLTPREFEILKQIVDGCKNREIADLLKVSIKTVEHHRASLMRKLKLRNMTDLIKFAVRHRMN